MSNYDVKESFIYDINSELIVVYKTIQNNPKQLINLLNEIKDEFIPKERDERKRILFRYPKII